MNKKILIIEDNPGIRMSVTDELEAEGYRVFATGNGNNGLAMVREKNPDLARLVANQLYDGALLTGGLLEDRKDLVNRNYELMSAALKSD